MIPDAVSVPRSCVGSQIGYGFALFYGGLVELCVGMWELWHNNMFAGVALSSYGAFRMSYAISQILALVSDLVTRGQMRFCCFALLVWKNLCK